VNITNTQILSSGQLNLAITGGAATFLMDRVDIRNCLDRACGTVYAYNPLTSGSRTMTRVTIWNPTSTALEAFRTQMVDLKIGKSLSRGDSSNVPGIISYNTLIDGSSNSSRQTQRSMLMVIDDQISGQQVWD